MRACSPSTKPFYPPNIRHSRSQKLMADSLRCRSPSFIAINPFSLPAKIYSGHFLHFYFIFYFFSNTRIRHMLCSLTASHSLPTPSPTLPSPFKRHQTAADGFAGAENVQSCGRFVKRRRCEIQKTFTWRCAGLQSPPRGLVWQRLEAFICLQKLHAVALNRGNRKKDGGIALSNTVI